jgi:hypothetical protein
MDVGKAVRYAFEDEKWANKLLVGTAVSLVPIFGTIAVTGYAIAVLRNVREGGSPVLPGWDELGQYSVDGLMFSVAALVYAIPFLVVACPVALVWLLPTAAGDNQDLTAVLVSLAGLVTVGLGCLGVLYAILLGLLTPVLQIRYAETGSLTASLHIGEVFRYLFRNIGAILVAQLLVWLLGLVVTSVLGTVIGAVSLVPICGWVVGPVLSLLMLPVVIWLAVFASHLYGQIARLSHNDAAERRLGVT